MNSREKRWDPLLTFRWGDEHYALPLALVHEVVRPGRMTPVPGAPHALLGAMALHGEVLAVADVRALLGPAIVSREQENSSERAIGSHRVIVAGEPGKDEAIGLLVDAVGEIWDGPMAWAGGEETDGYVAGQVTAPDGATVAVLDLPRLLAALDQQTASTR